MAVSSQIFKERLNLDLQVILKELHLPLLVYERILRIAVIGTEQSWPELQEALVREDMVTVQKIAHEWQGTYGNLRVVPMASLASEMHDLASKGGAGKNLAEILECLNKCFADLKESFQENSA
ncbi:MAG: Hpt domain-containing protein [Candidatus Omnitrophota bacterium]